MTEGTLTVDQDLKEFQEALRAKLRRVLLELNMSVTELAEEIGVSERAVRGWLSGEYSPRPKVRRRLERIFAELERSKP